MGIRASVINLLNVLEQIINPATEEKQDDIITLLETIDNFISGNRGLVTEDNSADIKTAVEAINTGLGKVLAGKSRIGNITITRVSGYITSIAIVEGGTTRTLTFTRDGDGYITNIDESIS